jgi:hypothetical protein
VSYTIAQLLFINLKQFPAVQAVKLYDANGQTQNPDGSADSVPLCLDPNYIPTPTITPTFTATFTATASATTRPTSTLRPTPTPLYNKVTVYFARNTRLINHLPPYEVGVTRYARSNISSYTTVLDQYFKGPGSTEYYSYGYRSIYDGFRGYSAFSISGNIARITLTGSCKREFESYSLAQLLQLNLKQFPTITYVKIYDEQGQTQDPDGMSDSVPVCLDINITPTPTPPVKTPTPGGPSLTPTTAPPPTSTPGPSPTATRASTATRWPSKTVRPTDTRWPTLTTRP